MGLIPFSTSTDCNAPLYSESYGMNLGSCFQFMLCNKHRALIFSEHIWSQEEHRNQGAWPFVAPRFENVIGVKVRITLIMCTKCVPANVFSPCLPVFSFLFLTLVRAKTLLWVGKLS